MHKHANKSNLTTTSFLKRKATNHNNTYTIGETMHTTIQTTQTKQPNKVKPVTEVHRCVNRGEYPVTRKLVESRG